MGDYKDKIRNTLIQVSDGKFNVPKEDFDAAMASDSEYRAKIYSTLKEVSGGQFNAPQKDFDAAFVSQPSKADAIGSTFKGGKEFKSPYESPIPTVTVKGDSVYNDKGIAVGESPKPIEFPAKELKAFSEGLMKLPANILNKPENRNIYYNTFSQKRNLNPNLVKQVGETVVVKNQILKWQDYLRQNPNDVKAYDQLAKLHESIGEDEEANQIKQATSGIELPSVGSGAWEQQPMARFQESTQGFSGKNGFTISEKVEPYADAFKDIYKDVKLDKERSAMANQVAADTQFSNMGLTAIPNNTPTAESSKLEDIYNATKMSSIVLPLMEKYNQYVADPASDMIIEGTKQAGEGAKLITKGSPISGALKSVVGLGTALIGVAGGASPLPFAAFTASMENIPGAEKVAMPFSYIKHQFEETNGAVPDWMNDATAVADFVWMAVAAHKIGKVKTEYDLNKELKKHIESLTPEEIRMYDDAIQEKRIELGEEGYKKYVESKITQDVSKLTDVVKEVEATDNGMQEYNPPPTPNSLRTLEPNVDVIFKGEVGKIEQGDVGDWYFVNGDGKSTQIKVTDKFNPTESLAELDIQVLPDVPESIIAKAVADGEHVGTVKYNGEEYFVSLEGNPNDLGGDLVFKVMADGSHKNIFDNHVNEKFGQDRKLAIANKFLNEKGLPNRTELKPPRKAGETPKAAEVVVESPKIEVVEEAPQVKTESAGGEAESKTSERIVYDREPTADDGVYKILGDENNVIYRVNPDTGRIQEYSDGLWSNTASNAMARGTARKQGFQKIKDPSKSEQPPKQENVTEEIAKEEVGGLESRNIKSVDEYIEPKEDAIKDGNTFELIRGNVYEGKGGVGQTKNIQGIGMADAMPSIFGDSLMERSIKESEKILSKSTDRLEIVQSEIDRLGKKDDRTTSEFQELEKLWRERNSLNNDIQTQTERLADFNKSNLEKERIEKENSELGLIWLTNEKETAKYYAEQLSKMPKAIIGERGNPTPNYDVVKVTPKKIFDLTKLTDENGSLYENDAKTAEIEGLLGIKLESLPDNPEYAYQLFRGRNAKKVVELLKEKGYDVARLKEGNQENFVLLDKNKPQQESPTTKTIKNEKENGVQEGRNDGEEVITESIQGEGEKRGQEVNKQEVVVAPAEEVVGEEVVSNGVKLEGSPREIIEELKGRKEDNAIHAEIFQSDGYNISIYDNKKTLADKKFKTHEEAKKFLQDWSSKNGNNNKSKYEYGTITDIANFPYRQEITGTLPKDFIDKIKAIEQPLKESSQPQPQKPIVAENEVSASKEVVEPPKVEKTIESVKAEPTIEEVKKTPIETVLEKLKKAEEEYKKLTDSSNLGAISNQEAIIKKQVEIIGIYVEYAKTLIKDGLSTAADLATALKKPLTVEIIRAFDIAKKNREVTEDAIADISKKFGTEVSGGKKNTLNSIDKEYAEGLSNEERLSAAKEEFKKDPIKFEERNDELTNEVLETNISDLKVSINQQAEYLVHIRNIDNKISALENDAAAAYKEGKNKKGLDIEQSINYLQERRAEINEAALKIGSSRGASLQFQRVIADRNFNIVGDIRMLEAKTGKKLSPEQIAEFEAIKKRSDDLVSEMEKLREKLLKNETQDAINAIKNDLEPKKTNKQGIKEELKEKIAARKVRKKELIDGLRKDYFQVFNDATSIGKMFLDKRIIELSKVILEDAADYASFSAEMVKEWGKDIKDYLPKLYKEVGGKEEAVLPSINAKGELQISEQTLRNLVAEGFDTPEKLTDKLYDLISPDLPTVTKEQIEVAYSRYGKQVKETPDVIGDKLREIRQTKKLMLAVKDLILGNLAKRSGKPRPPLTKEQRKLLQEVRARTKDLPLSVEESNKLYASALDTAKRRMQNRIDDLREQIDTNTKRLRAKNVLELDANGKELEAKLKDVQQEFNDTFGKNELTNEQKVDRVLKSLESRIEEAEKQQREGSRTTSEIPSKPVSSDAIKAGKMYIDWLKEAQAELDNASGLAQANAEVAKIKLLDRQIKKYQERTASRDFTPKVKKELDYIEDIAVKERQLEEEKFNYLVEKEKFLIENQSDLNKAGSLMYDILNTARAIMASYDLSAGGRQGAYYLPSYPREFASAWKGMIKDIRSDAAHNDYKYNLKSNKYYKLMKESGLFISDTHPVMKAKEEMYTGHIFNRIEDLRKTAEKQNWVGVPNEMKALLKINEKVAGGINASERAYVGFLNRLRTQIFIKNAELIQSGIRFDTKLFGKKVGMQLTKPSFAKENFKILADIINQGTGRGSITKSAEPLMQVLNWGMFSARFTVSRFTTVLKSLAHAMNPVNKVSATTRLILMKDLATFVATNTTLLYLAQNMFANDKNITVGTNPYDSDTYGTINVNGTNYSLWGGMNKSYAFAAQLYENRKDYGSVKKYETGRGNLAANYFGNKLAPIPGLIYHGVKGKNYRGDDFELSKELPNIFMPMTLSQGLNSKNNIEGRFINAVISGLGADAAERLPDSPYTAKKIAKESVAADRALMIYDALQKFNDKQLKELVMELAKDGGLLGKEDWNMLRVKLRQDDMSVTKVNELQKLYNKNIDIEDKIAATVRGRAEQLDKFFEVYKDDKGLALKKKAGNLKGIKVTDFYKVQDKTVESEFIYALKRAYPNLNGKELRVKYKTIINEYKDANLENK